MKYKVGDRVEAFVGQKYRFIGDIDFLLGPDCIWDYSVKVIKWLKPKDGNTGEVWAIQEADIVRRVR